MSEQKIVFRLGRYAIVERNVYTSQGYATGKKFYRVLETVTPQGHCIEWNGTWASTKGAFRAIFEQEFIDCKKRIQPCFPLGCLAATPGAMELEVNLGEYLARHAAGDWGEVSPQDKAENDLALKDGALRIFSAYDTPAGRLWIITEADRSATTLLTPEEY